MNLFVFKSMEISLLTAVSAGSSPQLFLKIN